MTDSPSARPGCGQWLLFLVLAGWLALLPLAVTTLLLALNDSPPYALVQLGLVAPGQPLLPQWVVGLFATALTLGLNLLLFVPLSLATRQQTDSFLHTTASLLIAIALVQAVDALARLAGQAVSASTPGPPDMGCTVTAAVRLALVLPGLLWGIGRMEVTRQEGWLRRWFRPAPMGLALAAGAIIVWPWVVVGSLGSPGTTLANVLQALPNALNEELLFRGLAFAWLWRAMAAPSPSAPAVSGRRQAALASLILFVAAQGGTALPNGDWEASLRFVSALLLGLLTIELTVRAGGSIWPAIVVHFLYDWFRLAFVDPRTVEEITHWLARAWAPLAAGGLGLLLWLGREVAAHLSPPQAGGKPWGRVAAAGLAGLAWAGVLGLYLAAGVPGFHADGFLIFLEEQADLRPAAAIADPVERRTWVYHNLAETAERSQGPLRAELDRRGVRYQPHYLVNAVEVLERPGLRRAFAGEPGVAAVLFQPGMRRYAYPFRIPNMDISGPQGVEWNVRAVGADRVWELGYIGQGVIVGNADTGVTWDHPALKTAYLGWDGSQVDHNYHWYDPWDGRAEPWDDNGHGTHTTGTSVGRDGENQVGLAPGARWIACRNMRHGLGNPGSYLSCLEFLLAPFPLGGDPLADGDPARGAQVVNNSWGCPRQEGCLPDTLRLAVENLRAAGQMMVASATNEGPACSTVQDPPALYDAALTVGATDASGRAAGFSSRGPVSADGSQRLKPDLVAPGVDVRSAVPTGYASLPGTSMAGPHVTGAVALLWSADPALVGELDRTEALLAETAQPRTVDAVCTAGQADPYTVCGCGGDAPGRVPNNVYGWGLVDVWAAVQMALAGQ